MVAPKSGKSDLHGQVALITGGAGAIGSAIAHTLAREGADLAILDRRESHSVCEAASGLGRRALGLTCDVADRSSVELAVGRALAEFKKVDILVLAAGVIPEAAIEDVSEAELEEVLDINLKGAFYPVQALWPSMKSNGYGRIVAIGSIVVATGSTRVGPHYVMSKGGVHALARYVAASGARYGITMNVVAPGAVQTENAAATADPWKGSRYAPLGRLAYPEDVAEAVLFLAGQASAMVTGTDLHVNGGIYKG